MEERTRSTIRNFLKGRSGAAPSQSPAPSDPSQDSLSSKAEKTPNAPQGNPEAGYPDPAQPPAADFLSASQDPQLEMSRVAPGMYKPVPEVLILEWIAPSRPFKKRNKQFFTTVLVIALLISLILFFSGQLLPIAMVFSVVFLNYVLSVVPPQDIRHTVTTFGINVEGKLYYWQELGRFWFDTKDGSQLLLVETVRFPGRITLVVPQEKKEEISQVLKEVLLNQKPPLSTFEKIARWLQEKFPLE